MNMNDCPKFNKCSAPVCPLHEGCLDTAYRPGESVCFYMLEYVKHGARARFKGDTTRELYQAISDNLPALLSRYAPLKHALNRAKNTPSRMGRKVGMRKPGEAA